LASLIGIAGRASLARMQCFHKAMLRLIRLYYSWRARWRARWLKHLF